MQHIRMDTHTRLKTQPVLTHAGCLQKETHCLQRETHCLRKEPDFRIRGWRCAMVDRGDGGGDEDVRKSGLRPGYVCGCMRKCVLWCVYAETLCGVCVAKNDFVYLIPPQPASGWDIG